MLCRAALFLLLFNAPSLLSEQHLENDEIAQHLWEQMISAKGGRERIATFTPCFSGKCRVIEP
jgi:hypothetical protein